MTDGTRNSEKRTDLTLFEDIKPKGDPDWDPDPSGMASGGLAPLMGEPTRTPMKKGKRTKKEEKSNSKRKEKGTYRRFDKAGSTC